MRNIVRFLNKLKYMSSYPNDVVEMRGQAYEKFQKEDFKLLDSEKAIFDWATKQTYIAMGNMMTGAASIEIDSCPIEGFNMEKTNEVLADKFGVDTSEYGISHMIAFGHRLIVPKEKTRQPMQDIVEWH